MAQARGIRIHQYLDDWLLRAPCPETCQRHTQTLLDLCRNLGWVVNMSKSELVPQQIFNFVGYRFNLSQGLVTPTQERWIALSQKINLLLGQETCLVRHFMSLIGLLTATEKQVVSGRLHMRPILWHLKKHWHVSEVLEKVIPLPKSLHVHLKWWLDPNNALKGQPLHPLCYALQLFTDASNEGWGAHLGDYTAKGLWSKAEGDLHINLLELKAGFISPKTVQAGLGTWSESRAYAVAIPQWVKRGRCIAHFEMYNVVVAFKKWAKHWAGRTVRVRSDNMAVVHALNNVAARDEFFGTCIRNLLMISAKHSVHFYAVHILGVWNTRADASHRLG